MTETEDLLRLTGSAMVIFGAAPEPEITLTRHGALALSGEPLADFNLAFIWPGDGAAGFLEHAASRARTRGLPLMAIAAPELAEALAPAAEACGLAMVGTIPLMVLRMAQAQGPSRRCDIRPAIGPDAGVVAGDLAASAFNLPRDVVARCWDVLMTATAPAQTFIAWSEGGPASAVTVTRHGTTVGIWTMATPPDRQGQGWGRALLTSVLDDCCRMGVDRAYLYASPAGFPLYSSIGFTALAEMPVWLLEA
jgi:GNAT superfamily N-acetyltransferase